MLPKSPYRVLPVPRDRVQTSLRSRRGLFALCIGAASISQLTEIPLALLIGQLVDQAPSITDASLVSPPVSQLLAGVAVLIVLRGVSRWLQVAWCERLAQSVLADLRFRMFAHLHRVRLKKLGRRDPGRIAARFAGDSASLRSWIATGLIESPTDGILMVVCLAVCAAIHPYLAAVALIAILPCVPLLLYIDPRVREDTRKARAEQARFTGEVVSTMRNAAAIRRADLQSTVRRVAIGRLRLVRETLARRGRREAVLRASVLTAGSLACGGVALVGVLLLRDARITIGSLISATWIASLIVGPLNRLAHAALMRGRSRVARERIAALFALPRERLIAKPPPAPRDHARLRFREAVFPLYCGGHTEPVEATLCGPGVFWLDGPLPACRYLARVMLREVPLQSGRIGLNGVRLGRHPYASLREMIWYADADQHGWRVDTSVWKEPAWSQAPNLALDLPFEATRKPLAVPAAQSSPAARLQSSVAAGITRRCKIMILEIPHDLDGSSRYNLHAWLGRNAMTRLFIVFGVTPPHEAFTHGEVLTLRTASTHDACHAPKSTSTGAVP